LCPAIRDQLIELGYKKDNVIASAPRWEDYSRSINQLYVSGIITESEKNKANKRLFNRIVKTVEKWKK